LCQSASARVGAGAGMAGAPDTLAVTIRPPAETWQVTKEAAGSSALVMQVATLAPVWGPQTRALLVLTSCCPVHQESSIDSAP